MSNNMCVIIYSFQDECNTHIHPISDWQVPKKVLLQTVSPCRGNLLHALKMHELMVVHVEGT